MSTMQQKSRQERALAQRTREFQLWVGGNADTADMASRCSSYGRGSTDAAQANEKKASIASREITTLKTKLGVRDEA